MGVIFIVVILCVVALVAMKVVPTYIEYKAIDKAVVKAAAAGGTVAEVRKSFGASAMIDDISIIGADDLEIAREGNTNIVSYSYAAKVPLFGPASIVIQYSGSSKGR